MKTRAQIESKLAKLRARLAATEDAARVLRQQIYGCERLLAGVERRAADETAQRYR